MLGMNNKKVTWCNQQDFVVTIKTGAYEDVVLGGRLDTDGFNPLRVFPDSVFSLSDTDLNFIVFVTTDSYYRSLYVFLRH